MKRRLWLIAIVLLIAAGLAIYFSRPRPRHVKDEARRAGRDAASFSAADEDYFHDMDAGISLTKEEVKGRNTWILWTGGNDRLWDQLSVKSVGTLDFLKTLSSYPKLKFNRSNRWSYLGLVNEPCFEQATGPDPQRFGLWLDQRRADCPPDPFENEAKYPGVKIGARGKNLPVGSFYGYATGIVGLRLFPNPDFDEAAAKKWDATKYYEDENYYSSKDLVKPYRVGMSCGFCHVGPSPTNPPADPENPKWENLSSVVGAQYFWVDRIFSWQADPRSFFYQLFHTSRPGTLDTSLVSTDNINNPRTMNAVYNLSSRLQLPRMTANWGKETLAGGELNNKQFNDFVHERPLQLPRMTANLELNNKQFNDFVHEVLTRLFQPPATVWTPRVLKDGSDSVGALGALNRVYLNIGLFSEEWLLHFRALVGGKPITPIEIAVARKNSAYWEATEQQTFDMALFLVRASAPHRLKSAPGGAAYLTKDQSQLTRGKIAFAERCARCHSSKLPAISPENDPGGCRPEKYLDCWNRYWNWTKTPEFKQEMKEIVLKNDFLEGNYLSTDLRVPVTLLQTNACSPLATNAIADNIWDNFSSQTYKNLPSVGSITWYHPVTGEPRTYRMPAGGRGYTRPASLISAWSTAPFLLNNSVGKFDPSPSVEARMASFQNSIEQMLWPEKRDQDLVLGGKIPGRIDRTTHTSYIFIAPGYLPDFLKPLLHPGRRLFPWLIGDEGIQIGPIPEGTPVDLLANLDLLGEAATPADRAERQARVFNLLSMMIGDLKSVEGKSDEEVRRKFANLVDPLLELSKCPDFIVNRGHYFGTTQFPEEPGLGDDEKRALIEFIKTF